MGRPDADTAVLAHLHRFDRGIAPTMDDIVNTLLAEHPQLSAADIRRSVAALDAAGHLQSRWDKDAFVYWAPTTRGT